MWVLVGGLGWLGGSVQEGSRELRSAAVPEHLVQPASRIPKLIQPRHLQPIQPPPYPTRQASPYTAGGRTVEFEHPCDYFTSGKAKASTLSLSVLVVIEML